MVVEICRFDWAYSFMDMLLVRDPLVTGIQPARGEEVSALTSHNHLTM